MFTGLIEAIGAVRDVERNGAGCRLSLSETTIAPQLVVGESVAVNGACLTVVERTGDLFQFDVVSETLQRTNLGLLVAGDFVNLERSLRVTDRLGGHLVQGHIDGTGRIVSRAKQGDGELVWFSCSGELATQMVPKGSVAIDGISLTIVDVSKDGFSVALIPHTLQLTTLGRKSPGATVNLETDLIGKYVWKYLQEISISRRP